MPRPASAPRRVDDEGAAPGARVFVVPEKANTMAVEDAAAKAGFGLASTFRGEFQAAITAFRYAVETDVDALRTLPLDKLLRDRIGTSVSAAARRAGEEFSSADDFDVGPLDALNLREAARGTAGQRGRGAMLVELGLPDHNFARTTI